MVTSSVRVPWHHLVRPPNFWACALFGPILLAVPLPKAAPSSHWGEEVALINRFVGMLPDAVGRVAKVRRGPLALNPMKSARNRRCALVLVVETHAGRLVPRLAQKIFAGLLVGHGVCPSGGTDCRWTPSLLLPDRRRPGHVVGDNGSTGRAVCAPKRLLYHKPNQPEQRRRVGLQRLCT